MSTPTKTQEADVKIEKVKFKYTFTDQERIELGLEAARQNSEAVNLDGQLSSVKKDYQGRIEGAENLRDRAFAKMTDGFEVRECDGVVEFNKPKKGLKSIYHLDAKKAGKRGEFIRDDPMVEADFQRELALEEEAKKSKKKGEPKAGQPLNPIAAAFSDDTSQPEPPHITQPSEQ